MERSSKGPTRKRITSSPKPTTRSNEHFGRQFVSDHIDAEVEFYWGLKVNVEVPRNKVLTGMAQHLQRSLTGQLLVGVFRRGWFEYNHMHHNFQEICNRSLNEVIIVDQFGSGYTGRQFLDIVTASEYM